jgi:predicted RNase H-like HicB family nuclease
MAPTLTLEYWEDKGWYVGRLREVPGVFSQGKSLEELEENIKDAYKLMLEDQPPVAQETYTKQLVLA